MLLKLLTAILLSYFLGSLTAAYYVTKWMIGKDIRKLGSGNAGAKNAGRHLGKKGFLYTLLLDMAKVIVALTITTIFFPENKIMLLISAFFLLVGHIWPMQLGFKGGKGVVVFLASTLFLVPIAIPVLGICFGTGYLFTRNFTMAGLISMASIPITAWIMGESYFAIGLFILLLILVHQHIKK
ncbi:glycerol-3-phosphate acyltransferase [Bacillus sp. FJAT-27251]|uniref:glycerol-3-phosphate acyltransferase n=1 Tax=Bacillus sp. FJAT-27251 TaxID=1684142 RepID=UPI0006A7849E|nr:glycerol-3-phosphate acyltransferase [Bacillus sp. FJAT-27251]